MSLPFAEALAVADSALGYSFVSAEQLQQAAESVRGPGRSRRLRVTRAADRRADNPFESALRAIVIDRGVTGFVPQQAVDTGRRILHVDLGDPRRRVALEADSFAHHGTRGALVRDCERYDELVSAGWRVLRFAYEHVMFRPGWVGDVVVSTCGAAPRG
jgi:very-short-patch-repair endonuclease